jgi:hypothetical protein
VDEKRGTELSTLSTCVDPCHLFFFRVYHTSPHHNTDLKGVALALVVVPLVLDLLDEVEVLRHEGHVGLAVTVHLPLVPVTTHRQI